MHIVPTEVIFTPHKIENFVHKNNKEKDENQPNSVNPLVASNLNLVGGEILISLSLFNSLG
jgi:hypothetical protein